MTGVVIVSAALLLGAVVLVLRRLELGPSILDRVLALDVLVSAILGGLALYISWTGRLDLLPVMVVLALVGFVGSVSVARFVASETDEDRKISGEPGARRRRGILRLTEGGGSREGGGS